MATFISLINLTQRAEEDIHHTVDRSDAFREAAGRHGATVKDIYWTLGGYDGVLIFDAPDDQTAAGLLLSLGASGNVRTQTLRAFDREEITSILGRIS